MLSDFFVCLSWWAKALENLENLTTLRNRQKAGISIQSRLPSVQEFLFFKAQDCILFWSICNFIRGTKLPPSHKPSKWHLHWDSWAQSNPIWLHRNPSSLRAILKHCIALGLGFVSSKLFQTQINYGPQKNPTEVSTSRSSPPSVILEFSLRTAQELHKQKRYVHSPLTAREGNDSMDEAAQGEN